MRHKDGTWRYIEMVANNLLEDASVGGIVLNSRDITERTTLRDRLQHQAFHDPLTGMPNRALFLDRLKHALVRASRRQESVTVMFLDLDNFKVINDSLGHQGGDQLLIAIGERLKQCLRPADTAARLGGDEFTVLLDELTDTKDALEIAKRIQANLQAPLDLDGHEVFTTVSIGIVISTAETEHPETVLRDADVAMYRAKTSGKAQYAIFDRSMNQHALERLQLASDLRHAIDRGELRVFFQPLIDLPSGRISGTEALVRWQHPGRGLLLPGAFIQLAEETGMIMSIGMWVLEEACRQTRLWQDQHAQEPPLTVSVNVSARQFQHPTLANDVAGILARTGLAPQCLELELTESILMENAQANLATLQQIKQLGVQLAIDDFGTGYSSLAYLKQFPIDILKVDRSFIDQLGHPTSDNAIVEAIRTIALALNLNIVGEGIENANQLAHLQRLGYHRGQGYYFARPVAAADLAGLLDTTPIDIADVHQEIVA